MRGAGLFDLDGIALDVLAERDVKGLYKRALAGEIKNFTGVDDPYEAPLTSEIIVETDLESADESAARIIARLEEMSLVMPSSRDYNENDEESRRSLDTTGYA